MQEHTCYLCSIVASALFADMHALDGDVLPIAVTVGLRIVGVRRDTDDTSGHLWSSAKQGHKVAFRNLVRRTLVFLTPCYVWENFVLWKILAAPQ